MRKGLSPLQSVRCPPMQFLTIAGNALPRMKLPSLIKRRKMGKCRTCSCSLKKSKSAHLVSSLTCLIMIIIKLE